MSARIPLEYERYAMAGLETFADRLQDAGFDEAAAMAEYEADRYRARACIPCPVCDWPRGEPEPVACPVCGR